MAAGRAARLLPLGLALLSACSEALLPRGGEGGIAPGARLAAAAAPPSGGPSVTLNNGVVMPILAAGTWKLDEPDAQDTVAAALSAGFRHIDTANDYYNQRGVGAAIAQATAAGNLTRREVFVTTKVPGCGSRGVSRASAAACAADSVRAAESNLEQLGLAQVDLLLVHFPPRGGCGPAECELMQAQWTALSRFYRANKTRALVGARGRARRVRGLARRRVEAWRPRRGVFGDRHAEPEHRPGAARRPPPPQRLPQRFCTTAVVRIVIRYRRCD